MWTQYQLSQLLRPQAPEVEWQLYSWCKMGWNTRMRNKFKVYIRMIIALQGKYHGLEGSNWVVIFEIFLLHMATNSSRPLTQNCKPWCCSNNIGHMQCYMVLRAYQQVQSKSKQMPSDCVRWATDAISWPYFVRGINTATTLEHRLIWVYVCKGCCEEGCCN